MNRFGLPKFISRRKRKSGGKRNRARRRTQLRAEHLEQRALLAALVDGLGGPNGFGENNLVANDDESTAQVSTAAVFPNGLNFFGTTYSSVFFNNNGNITFDSPQSTFTPFAITGNTGNPLIAPFFADVDTRGGAVTPSPGGNSVGTNLLHYDLDTTNGILTATWDDVGPFNTSTNLQNAFQVQLIDQSAGNSPGDFDIRFIYENLQWTVGTASGTTHARAGYSSGNGTDFFELPESGSASEVLDLVNRSNIGVDGEYLFTVRNGVVADPPDVSFLSDTFSVSEGAGTATITLQRTGDLSAQSIVNVALDAGSTATPGDDFDETILATNVQFAPNVATATVVIPITDDVISEPDEIVNLAVSSVFNAEIVAPTTTELTILDNEGALTISINDASANEDAGTIDFEVTLSGVSASPVFVEFVTANGTATAGLDYVGFGGGGFVVFDPGETSQPASISLIDDPLDEPDETFEVNLFGAIGATIADDQGIGTILDDEPTPDVIIGDAFAVEGDAASFEVSLTSPSSTNTILTVGTSDGTALAGDDFRTTISQVVIPAGSLTATANLDVPTFSDNFYEGNGIENFTVGVVSVDAGTVGNTSDTGLGEIQDIDPVPTVTVTQGLQVTEGAVGQLALTLSHGSFEDIVVQVGYTDGTAVSPDDYDSTSQPIIISTGSLVSSFQVPTTEDPFDEPNETFSVVLQSVLAGTVNLGPDEVVTILDDDDPPTISINDASGLENGSNVVFDVTLSAPSEQPIFVEYTTADITAAAGADYVGLGATGSVLFSPGETSKPATIFLIDDALDEPDETFEVNLINPVNAAILDGQGIGTIIDDDPTPDVIIRDQTVNEGDTAVFSVELTGPSSEDITLTLGTSDGSAVSPEDYNGRSAQVGFSAGNTTTTFDVSTLIDNLFEGPVPETFTVGVVSVDSGTVLDTSDTGLGQIIDIDVAPDIAIVAGVPLPEDIGDAMFSVELSHASSENITVTIGTTDGTAVSPDDYTFAAAPVNILAGTLSALFPVTVVDDSLDEPDENFTLSIDNVVGTVGAIGGPVQATILDNDDPPTVSISGVTVNEDVGIANFDVTLSAASANPVFVDYNTADLTALDGFDYIGVTTSGIVFNPGVITQQIGIQIVDDSLDEPDETFEVILTSSSGATILDDIGLGTIVDNDATPDVLIDDQLVVEGETATFTVSLTSPSGNDVTVTLGTSDGTAVSPDDYNGPDAQVTIPAGTLTGATTFDVDTFADGFYEGGGDETFTVGVVSVDDGTVGDTSATGLGEILDDDFEPFVDVVARDPVTEGEIATFDIELDLPSFEDITVTIGTSDGTAIAPDDYEETTMQVTIPSGSTGATFDVQTVDDALDELDEDFTVELVSLDAGEAVLGSDDIGVILDNDDPPTVSVADASFDEGVGIANFDVTLSTASSFTVTVDFATVDGTATGGFDYSGFSVPTSLTFNPGETNKTFGIQIVEDPLDETDETFELNVVGATNAVVGDGSAIGTILDNDPTPNVIIGDAIGDEGTSVSFNVSLSSPSSEETVLTIGTTDGTAVSPADFTGPNTQITIPAGSTTATATFDVALLLDSETEVDENFTVGVVSVDAGSVGNTSDTGLGTIVSVTNAFIIDNGDLGYSTTGDWTYISGIGKGHENDFELASPGNGIDVATWAFDLDDPGEYLVSVSYRDFHRLRATNAPFTVMDNGFELATVPVNQLVAANDTLDSGTWFEDLGVFNIFSKQLSVSLSDDADDFVIADAVRIQRIGGLTDGPEIQVDAFGSDVQDDIGVVDLGEVTLTAPVIQKVTVSNSGNQILILDGPINLTGGLTLSSTFGDLSLNPGESTIFEVRVDTSTLGGVSGEVTFGHNDPSEDPFNFTIQADVVSRAIIDDGDPGFSTVGDFGVVPRNGFQNDFRFANSGTGNNQANWAFNVGDGVYEVSATWVPFNNRATNAPFSVWDDTRALATVPVDQTIAPAGILDGGTWFTSLGTFEVFSNTLIVSLDDSVPNLVIADAIRIDRVGDVVPSPEIRVETGGNNLADDTGLVDLGTVTAGSTVVRTFTVTNDGLTPLSLSGPIDVPAGFSVAAPFGSTLLLQGESTTFDLALDTSVAGTFTGQVSFANNDVDENPFNFDIQAEVTPFVTFATVVDNSDGAPDYTTVGPWLTVNRNGHLGGFQYAIKGDGSTVATWTVDLPQSGTYRVSTAYRAFSNRVTDAPFTVFDGAIPLATVDVNQQIAPNDLFDQGTWFEDLGTFSINGNQLVVQLSNFSSDTDPAHYLAIADAIRVERIGN